MREFRYSALTQSGHTVEGLRRAPNVDELAAQLLEQNLVLLKSRATLGSFGLAFSSAGRAGRKELRIFTQHMATCLSAGITAIEALSDFGGQSKGEFRTIVNDIKNEINSGTQIDESFAKHPEVFSEVYLAMLTAGQNSGNLDASFKELVDYLEWQDDLRSKTGQAMVYPSILVCGIVGLFTLLLLFVIPRFKSIFEDSDFTLPMLTQKILALSGFMAHWWWLIAGIILAVVIASKFYVKTEAGRYNRDRLLLRMPVIGSFVHQLALSRFAKNFAIIFGSGIDLLSLLQLLERVVGNEVMALEIKRIRQRVETGESLVESFSAAKVFPPLIQRLIAVGEKTGSLDTSLLMASEYLDKEIPRALKKAFMIFEAMVIAILGILVCVAALSILMPIMQIKAQMS